MMNGFRCLSVCCVLHHIIMVVNSYNCEDVCGKEVYHATGYCHAVTKRCRCKPGWTGPNAEWAFGAANNQIDAEHCEIPCFYNKDFKNERCITAEEKSALNHDDHTQKLQCNSECRLGKGGALKCLGHGYCLCHYGWSGDDAIFLETGEYKNMIAARTCDKPCYWTHIVNGSSDNTCGGAA